MGVVIDSQGDAEFWLRQAQSMASLGHYVFDIVAGTWTCSEELERIFGIRGSEPRSVQAWLDLAHPDERPALTDYLQQHVIAQRQTFDREYRVVRIDDGVERWVHGRGQLRFDDAGRPVTMFGTIQDITSRRLARHQAEAEARRHTAELEFLSRSALTMLEVAPDEDLYVVIGALAAELLPGRILAISGCSPNGDFQPRDLRGVDRMRAALKRVLGQDVTELHGDFGPEARREVPSGRLHRVSTGLSDFPHLLPPMMMRGVQRLLDITTYDIVGFAKQGRILGALSIFSRGTSEPLNTSLIEAFSGQAAAALDRWQVERAQRASEERLRAVFDAVTDAILFTDQQSGQITLANTAASALFGRTERELLQLHAGDLRGAKNGPSLADVLVQQPRAQAPVSALLSRSDGSTFHAELHAEPATIGERQGLVCCVRDVSEQQQLRARVAQAERLSTTGLLAAGVAHEINNPLTYVLSNLEGALDDALSAAGGASPETMDGIVEQLKESLAGVLRIREIARGLGTFSRVDSSQTERIQLEAPCEQAIAMARNEVRFRARLVKQFEAVPPVLASAGRLAQVFLNLLINAAHSIEEGDPEHHEIRVRIWAEHGQVCAEVSDTGRGVPPELASRLFEPFVSSKGSGGSGLGLSICKNIVTGLGGTIDFTNEGGKGTRFVIRLPAAAAQQPAPAASATPTMVAAQRSRILVVDDEPAIRRALVRILGAEHEVVSAASAEEARALLMKDQGFDLLLLDLMMGGSTGTDLHAWLATSWPALAARSVFLSGGTFTPRVTEYVHACGVPMVEKPFERAALTALVREWVLSSRRGQDGSSARPARGHSA